MRETRPPYDAARLSFSGPPLLPARVAAREWPALSLLDTVTLRCLSRSTARRARTLVVAATAVLFAWAPVRVSAQSCNASSEALSGSCSFNATLSAIIPFMARLSSSTSTTSLGVLDNAALSSGSTVTTGPTVSAVANFAWSVSVKAGAADWSFVGTVTDPHKSSEDLRWRIADGPLTAISTTGAQVISGAAGIAATATLTFSTLWPWSSSPPGTYTLPVTLTLTAP